MEQGGGHGCARRWGGGHHVRFPCLVVIWGHDWWRGPLSVLLVVSPFVLGLVGWVWTRRHPMTRRALVVRVLVRGLVGTAAAVVLVVAVAAAIFYVGWGRQPD